MTELAPPSAPSPAAAAAGADTGSLRRLRIAALPRPASTSTADHAIPGPLTPSEAQSSSPCCSPAPALLVLAEEACNEARKDVPAAAAGLQALRACAPGKRCCMQSSAGAPNAGWAARQGRRPLVCARRPKSRRAVLQAPNRRRRHMAPRWRTRGRPWAQAAAPSSPGRRASAALTTRMTLACRRRLLPSPAARTRGCGQPSGTSPHHLCSGSPCRPTSPAPSRPGRRRRCRSWRCARSASGTCRSESPCWSASWPWCSRRRQRRGACTPESIADEVAHLRAA